MAMKTDVLVIGAGPGGYPAAFRLAARGKKVLLVDADPRPGGVCLHRGCIPSKALLHAGSVLDAAKEATAFGVKFAAPRIDVDRLRAWRQGVVDRHAVALAKQVKHLGIGWLQGRAKLLDGRSAAVAIEGGGEERVAFEHAIIATGSIPFDPGLGVGHPRVLDSTGALALPDVPRRLLVVGGGYIGLELGQAYASLGSSVTAVEMLDSLLAGVDRDLAGVLEQRLRHQFAGILTGTKVTEMRPGDDAVHVRFEGATAPREAQAFDRVLVAVGRRPNSRDLGLENTAVRTDRQGFVVVDERQRTDEPTCYAIGDVAGQPMLAHKATRQGLVAADAILGVRSAAFEPHAIPAVVFTDPEIAWCGLTEAAAAQAGIALRVGRFPWAASGRATTLGRTDGLTKVLADPGTGRVLGVGIAGPGAGELIGEAVVAIEMGAVAEDLASSIHAHPTLAETLMEAAAAAAPTPEG